MYLSTDLGHMSGYGLVWTKSPSVVNSISWKEIKNLVIESSFMPVQAMRTNDHAPVVTDTRPTAVISTIGELELHAEIFRKNFPQQ